MSSVVVSTSAALGRPFLFDDDAESGGASPLALARSGQASTTSAEAKKPAGKEDARAEFIRSSIGERQSSIPLTSASRLQIRPTPEMGSSGIAALDSLVGGLPRGCLTEICGPASSGRSSVMLAALAAGTRREEFCALIDASDALDPHSASAAGINLDRFLWVRCGEDSGQRHRLADKAKVRRQTSAAHEFERRLEKVLRATDLLLESGGFGLIVLDLADIPPQAARHIPLTTWFRFRRAVEHKPTILLSLEQQPIAGSCSSLLLKLHAPSSRLSGLSSTAGSSDAVDDHQSASATHTNLLRGLEIKAELVRSRLERKPTLSATFETTAAWVA